jgi:hypothetical protein
MKDETLVYLGVGVKTEPFQVTANLPGVWQPLRMIVLS